jgi:hypothetical protein
MDWKCPCCGHKLGEIKMNPPATCAPMPITEYYPWGNTAGAAAMPIIKLNDPTIAAGANSNSLIR